MNLSDPQVRLLPVILENGDLYVRAKDVRVLFKFPTSLADLLGRKLSEPKPMTEVLETK